MATFDVKVRRLDNVLAHPQAPQLEQAVVGGFRCVVEGGRFHPGDLVAYVPEGAVLPLELARQLGVEDKLDGPQGNRVHPLRVHGVLSQGLVLPSLPHWKEGDSVMEELGIAKFVPPVPPELEGEAYALEEHERLDFDIENLKAFPGVIQEGEPVVITEKIHGVFMAVGAVPPALSRKDCGHRNGCSYVASKGLLANRMAFAPSVSNLYTQAADRLGLHDLVQDLAVRWGTPVLLLGELFGQGVQDLGYAQMPGLPQFRVFAIVRRNADHQPCYLDDKELSALVSHMGLVRVPVLYRGTFCPEVVKFYTQGLETVSGASSHLREGVIITPQKERTCPEIGRVALKSISEDYLMRDGATEYA